MSVSKYDFIRLAFIVILWVALCYLVIAGQKFSLKVAFVLIASGIIVFVPIYKKYKKKSDK